MSRRNEAYVRTTPCQLTSTCWAVFGHCPTIANYKENPSCIVSIVAFDLSRILVSFRDSIRFEIPNFVVFSIILTPI